MKSQLPCHDLLQHLRHSNQLPTNEANKILQEFLAYFSESTEQFVQRRHRELQRAGLRNPQIFDEIQQELTFRRFSAPSFSNRQLRRIIYG